MRAFDRDLIRAGHYGQRPVCRANRPNTWLHRPACKREENPCQLGAVYTWHKADLPRWSATCPLSGAKRTWPKDGATSAYDPVADIRKLFALSSRPLSA